MWARVVETMLACWLAISPLVFHRGQAPPALWWIDLSAAALVALLALASYWPPTQYAHLGIIAIGLGLLAVGMLGESPSASTDQNHVIIGLMLLMFAIIPNAATCPPAAWRKFDERE